MNVDDALRLFPSESIHNLPIRDITNGVQVGDSRHFIAQMAFGYIEIVTDDNEVVGSISSGTFIGVRIIDGDNTNEYMIDFRDIWNAICKHKGQKHLMTELFGYSEEYVNEYADKVKARQVVRETDDHPDPQFVMRNDLVVENQPSSFLMEHKARVAIVVDYMASIGESVDEQIDTILNNLRAIGIDPVVVYRGTNIYEVPGRGVDLLIIDYGGLYVQPGISVSMASDPVQYACEYAEERTGSTLLVLWTQYTSLIYQNELKDMFGENPANILFRFYDNHEEVDQKIIQWVSRS